MNEIDILLKSFFKHIFAFEDWQSMLFPCAAWKWGIFMLQASNVHSTRYTRQFPKPPTDPRSGNHDPSQTSRTAHTRSRDWSSIERNYRQEAEEIMQMDEAYQ